MTLLSMPSIKERILGHSPASPAAPASTRQAAVAVVLKAMQDRTEALFILRATREGDPWSGHIAFPGGHQDAIDTNLQQTAERETLEEVGLNLSACCRFIGQLDSVRANPRGRNIDLVVTPFVYELLGNEAELSPNYEVAEVLWGSLNAMHSGDAHIMGEFNIAGQAVRHPGFDLHGKVVWGLTYRMLEQLFALLDPAWEPYTSPAALGQAAAHQPS